MSIQRDEKGRFLPGQQMPAGPGRPSRQTEQDYLAVTIAEVSLDDWRAVVRQALKDAKKGNGYARQWLSEYLIGKPPQILDIRAADAKLLSDVLKRLDDVGMSASEMFNALLVELNSVEQEEGE